MTFIDKKFEDLKIGDIVVFSTEGGGYIFDYLQVCEIQGEVHGFLEKRLVIQSNAGRFELKESTFNNHFKVTRNKKIGLI